MLIFKFFAYIYETLSPKLTMKKNLIPLFVALLCITFSSQGQENPPLKESESNHIDVIKIYENVLAEGYESAQIYQKLAHANFARENYQDAKKWFQKWFELEANLSPSAYYHYSKTLEYLNETEKAKEFFELFQKLSKK
jgi:tetratricopeptide (TPR) repeat protein